MTAGGRVVATARSLGRRLPRVGSGLAAAAVLQALGGAVCWAAVLALGDDGVVGGYGSTQLAVQLGGLLGAAGAPVVVLRHGRAGGRRLWRVTLAAAVLGGGGATAVALLAGRVDPGAVGWLLIALTAPLAAAATTIDAWLVVADRWRALFTRLAATYALRLVAIAGAVATDHPAGAVLAVLAPEALGAAWAAVRSRRPLDPVPAVWPTGLRSFAAAQYLAALTTFGPLLVVPLLAAGPMSVDDRAAFLPAWAGMAVVFAATHGVTSGRLVDGQPGGDRRTRGLAVAAGLATGVGAIASAAVAGSAGVGHRWVAALAATGLLLVVGAPWPAVAARLADARREGRDRLAVALVAPIAVVPLAVALGAPTTPTTVAAMWGGALVLCCCVGSASGARVAA